MKHVNVLPLISDPEALENSSFSNRILAMVLPGYNSQFGDT